MGTIQKSNDNNSLISLFIGIAVLIFLGLVALWVIGIILKIVITLLPVAGVGLAVVGGVWYLNAKNDKYRLRAVSLFALGLFLLLITIIF